MNLIETNCSEQRRLEATANGYKVVVNLTTRSGKIESLHGSINPAEAADGDYMMEGNSFSAYKNANGWRTECRAANSVYAEVSAIALEAVNDAVAKYETA